MRKGGENDPLEEQLKAKSLKQYQQQAKTGKKKKFPRKPHFFLDDHDNIIPDDRSGKRRN